MSEFDLDPGGRVADAMMADVVLSEDLVRRRGGLMGRLLGTDKLHRTHDERWPVRMCDLCRPIADALALFDETVEVE